MADVVYVDIVDGVKRIMNNTKLYVKLLTKFRDDTRLTELEEALAAGDMERAQNAAHTVKGVAANLSLAELFKQCVELEAQIKAGSINPSQLGTVQTVFAATMQEVEKVIAQNA